MIKRTLILLFLFSALLAVSAFSQSSASATMRVSVRVVSGTNVEIKQPNTVALYSDTVSSLGALVLNGLDDESVLISSSEKINLIDSDGNEITLDIMSKREKKDANNSISFEGRSKGKMMVSNIYRGKLETTINYF